MSEIEEIKKRLRNRYILACANVDDFYNIKIADPKVRTEYAPNLNKAIEDIQTLLSSLEKEEELRARAEWEGGWAIDPEYYVSKVELEKEKEGADKDIKELESRLFQANVKAREIQVLSDEKCKWFLERAKQAEKRLEAERISVNELSLANQNLVEKVGELDDRIVELVILIDEYAGRIMKGKERIKELERAIQRAQEENSDEKHCTCVPLLKVKIKELEAQLATIKADESIGKLETKDGCKPSVLSELLDCPFCGGKATLIKKEDSFWPRDMVTCKNEECELTDWIPYDDWQRRAI